MQNEKVELLAPAGNPEGFMGAIHAGADAVYLGGSQYGARAYADNFTTEELVHCIRYAHFFDRKVYLTVNTLVKDSELYGLYDYMLPFYEAGLDGVIIQDIGVFAYLKEHFPELALHVSTQMTVTGSHGAKILKDMGACRIVPARELSLAEIHEMKQETGLEMETFIHGAMCYCYSGQCLFSSMLGGRSGNRGRCAQPCRLPYEVKGRDFSLQGCYPLSLKDMCTIEHIPALIEGGIDSFKIEGRMKKPEYAAGVTAIYRKYIDLYYNTGGCQGQDFNIAAEDLDALSRLYIRSERQDGYYYKQNGRDMVTLKSPAYSGNDELLLERIRRQHLTQPLQHNITIYSVFRVGEPAQVTLVIEGSSIAVTVLGEEITPAQKQPITRENITRQLSRLGESCFTPTHIEIAADENAFYPLKKINDLRREAVAGLEEALLSENGFPVKRSSAVAPKEGGAVFPVSGTVPETGHSIGVSISNREQFLSVMEYMEGNNHGITRIYPEGNILVGDRELIPVCKSISSQCEIIPSLPYILRAADEAYMKKLLTVYKEAGCFQGILVRSLEGLGFLKQNGFEGEIYTDAGFYIWNCETLRQWQNRINGFCLPLELNASEQKKLIKYNNQSIGMHCEKKIYGRIPMMITANCVVKTGGRCQRENTINDAILTDRYRKQFPVVTNCIQCYNVIYNSVPLSLHKNWRRLLDRSSVRIDFTTESGSEAVEILNYYMYLSEKEQPAYEYTTGHEKRGVE